MENIVTKLFFLIILWLVGIYSIVCESGNNITSEISTSLRKSPKFSNITIILCHCNIGEVMDLSGECHPHESGTDVATLSKSGSETQLIDVREFNVTVHKTLCEHPQVHLRENEFILLLEGVSELKVIDGPFRGLTVADYCVHHQWNQGKVKATAQGCVSVPEVPRCCQMDNGDCSNNSHTPSSFNPPLVTGPHGDQSLAGAPFPWEFHQKRVAKPSCQSGDVLKKVELDDHKAYLAALPNVVTLNWQPAGGQRMYINHTNYCVDFMKDENKYYAYICHLDLHVYCTNNNCSLKCCPNGEALSWEVKGCAPSDLPYTIPSQSLPNPMATFYSYPLCTNEEYPEHVRDFKLIMNGSLIHKDTSHSSGMYCIDNFIRGNSIEQGALVCEEKDKGTFENIRLSIFPPCAVVSCGFLSLLLLLHAWIPKLREKDGMYQLFHASSLLIAFAVNGMLLYLPPRGYTFGGFCVPIAFVMQFSYLSAFFWLNTMCFDIWRRFRKLAKNLYSPVSCVPLWKYMLYAVGGPVIITLVTIIVQCVAPRDGSISGLVHPLIGEVSCWFRGIRETVPYYYLPISLLYILNLIFIGNTYYHLKIIQKELTCDIGSSGNIDNRNTDIVTAFWQQFSLLMVLTVLWTGEILSHIIPPKEIWLPTDILNFLQGVFIFFVFLINNKKRGYLKEQLPKLLEFTNIWIDETDAAQADINNHNPGLSRKKSSLHFISSTFATTSFDLNKISTNVAIGPNRILPLSIVHNVSESSDPSIHPGEAVSNFQQ